MLVYKKLKEELIKLYKIIKTELWATNLKEFNICLRPLLFLCRFFYLVFIDFAQKKTNGMDGVIEQ